MSFTVDDLVSSLSSSHIGQEAMDLAALQVHCPPSPHNHANPFPQAQLSATLFSSTAPPSSFSRGRAHQTCTTPIARTPSSSTMGMSIDTSSKRRSSISHKRMDSSSSQYGYGYQQQPQADDMYGMEEDERMVEELLMPSSPMVSASSSMSHYSYSNPMPSSPVAPSPSTGFFSTHPHHHHHHHHHSNEPQSLFTSQDPFYLAQLQASSQPFASSQNMSGFAQHGRIAPGSRFAPGPLGQAQTTF